MPWRISHPNLRKLGFFMKMIICTYTSSLWRNHTKTAFQGWRRLLVLLQVNPDLKLKNAIFESFNHLSNIIAFMMIGNASTHTSNILLSAKFYGKTGSWEVIRHMLAVSKSLLRPPGTCLKCTKCLLLHLLIFCVLCVVCDTSLPQTSW